MDQRSGEDMVAFVAIENQMRLETKLIEGAGESLPG